MSKSPDFGSTDVYTLSDRSLYRLLEQQDDGFHELPDEQEFAKLETSSHRKRLSRIGKRLSYFIAKRRRYAQQPV